MLKCTVRTPAMILVSAAVGWIALLVTDVGTAIEDGNVAPLWADLRTTIVICALMGTIWLFVLLRHNAQLHLRAELAGMHQRLDHLEEKTQPIPRVRAAVGSAPVLPVEVLSTRPPLDREVLDIATRLQGRVHRAADDL
jgi:hypothetical protein